MVKIIANRNTSAFLRLGFMYLAVKNEVVLLTAQK